MMRNEILLLVTAGFLGVELATQADILELKNGGILNGKYAGGTAGTLRFDTSGGQQIIETSQAVALTFTTPAPVAAPPAPAPAPVPTAAPSSVTLSAGTTLLVRMMDSVSSRNGAGSPFTTRLEYDLGVGGAVALKGGTIIYGRVASSTQAGRAVGRSTLDLRLAQIVVNGQPMPIITSGYQAAGQASIAKAAKGAAAGAAIGAIAGDAGKGAAIGATAGALTRGQTITISPGTLLEFTLMQPVTILVPN
ncbi:MAG TPA: hypothetical protein VKY92_04645 [Verrucomicrobiae bacterium]|nr:hypothetical protein [Verrucomicrobiae bacterium]